VNISQELLDYLHELIAPPDGKILVLMSLEDVSFENYKDECCHGLIAQGTPTEDQTNEMMRILKPGAHLMLIASEDRPTGHQGACALEDAGFEIRDSIFLAQGNESFWYIPKAAKAERHAGVISHPKQRDDIRKEGDVGGDNPRNRGFKKVRNFHPTVKPVAIMEALLQVVPKDALVIDPFMGSGTTGIAVLNTGHDFIGIEMEEDYIELADQRIRYWDREKKGWIAADIQSEVEIEVEEVTLDIEDLLGL